MVKAGQCRVSFDRQAGKEKYGRESEETVEKENSTEKENSMEKENSIKKENSMEKDAADMDSVRAESPVEEAVGLLEVYGLTCAFLAADAGCKAADVWLETFDKNKPANADSLPVPLLVTVKFRGSVAAVEAAMEAGEAMAKSVTGVVQRHIIPRPTKDTEKMLKISAFDKN